MFTSQYVDIGEVKAYWEEHVTDWKISTHESGSKAFFEEIDDYRFEKLHYLPKVIDFNSYPGKDVLEVGCGLANDLSHFARGGATVTGIDITERAVELATRNFKHRGLSGNFIRMDGESLEFPDNNFDIVYCHTVLQFTPDPVKVINEIYRVLKPGGIAILMGINKQSWLIALHRLLKIEIDYLDSPVFHKFSTGEFKEKLRKFSKIKIIYERFPVKTKVHKGLKARIFNLVFVDIFNLLPKRLINRVGHHLIVYATK